MKNMIVSIAMMLFTSVPSFAAESSVRKISLDEALKIAAERNYDIQKAREYRKKLEGRYIEERAAALPNLSVSSGYWKERDASGKAMGLPNVTNSHANAELGFSQVLFAWGQVSASIKAAEAGLLTGDDLLTVYRDGALRETAAAYYDAVLARELRSIAKQNLEQKQRHLDEAQKKFDAGVATEYDVLAGRVSVENAKPAVSRSENLVKTTLDRVKFLLLIEESSEIEVTGDLSVKPEGEVKKEEAVTLALARRPELSEIEHRKAAYNELVTIVNAGDKPRLDLKGGYGWRYWDMGQASADGVAWNVGVYMSFPFFDGMKTKGKVMQARSDLATVSIEQAKLRESIALQVRDAVNGVQESAEIVKGLAGTVEQAAKLLDMAEKGFTFGVKTRLEVDDAQVNLLQAKGNLARSQHDYLVAKKALEWATGVIAEQTAAPNPAPAKTSMAVIDNSRQLIDVR